LLLKTLDLPDILVDAADKTLYDTFTLILLKDAIVVPAFNLAAQ